MKGWFALMKSGIVLFGIVPAFLLIGGCGSKSSPTGMNNLPYSAPGMVLIPGGTFQMGSANTELEAWTQNDEEPVHSVTVSAFYMDCTLVTQANYQSLMGVNPSNFDKGASALRRPVEFVTWYDAVLYCNARSKHDEYDTIYSYTAALKDSIWDTSLVNLECNFSANGYRLPTEAEYEYGCRAGTMTDYYWGQSFPPLTTTDTEEINAHAWSYYNSPNGTQPVGTKPPNRWGLEDMSGNVWEWCNDWWAQGYTSGSLTDPTGPSSSQNGHRVQRGGSWGWAGLNVLCAAYRLHEYPSSCYCAYGFRCVRR